MPLTKKYAKDKKSCTVGFLLPAEAAGGAKKLFLAGEFNAWDPAAKPMRKVKGVFRASLKLAAGTSYQYRFVTDAGVWLNDTAPDDTAPSGIAGAENSVATL